MIFPRRLWQALTTLAVVAGVLLLPGTPAQAHAALVRSSPEPGSVVQAAPSEITLTFNEEVGAVPGRIQVLAPDGKRISESVSTEGRTIRIALRRADQPRGTYLVSYRIVSGDTHPVGNAMIFSVGAPSTRPVDSDPFAVHPSVTTAVSVLKFLGYAGLTLAVGPALFLALLWPRRLPRRGPILLVRAGLVLVGAATAGALWAQAPYRSGAALWDVGAVELSDVLASPFGIILSVRLAALGIVAGLLPPVLRGTAGRLRGIAVVLVSMAGLTTWPLTGHSVVSPLPYAVIAADLVHLAAMAVWIGGLVTLSVFLLRRAHPRVLGVVLPAWSRWAALSVVWLVGAGVVQAVVQLGSVGALWQTGYGRLLSAKVVILAGVLALAALARAFVRRNRAPAEGPGRLRRMVAAEVAATAVILGLSAVLVEATPGRNDGPAFEAPTEVGYAETLNAEYFTLQFNIFPVEIGEYNTVHGFTYTPEGKQLQAPEWKVTTRYLDKDLEAVTEPMLPLPLPGRNDAVGSLTFPYPGRYEITFTIRINELDQSTVRTTITVPVK